MELVSCNIAISKGVTIMQQWENGIIGIKHPWCSGGHMALHVVYGKGDRGRLGPQEIGRENDQRCQSEDKLVFLFRIHDITSCFLPLVYLKKWAKSLHSGLHFEYHIDMQAVI